MIAVEEKMEKEKGRKIPFDEVFEEMHLKKKKNPTDEDVWVEPRAKAAHDKYKQLLSEFRSSQPPESQGDPVPQHVEEELWEQTVGPTVRDHFYGYHRNYLGENVRSSSSPTSYTSSVDRETIESLKNMVSKLIEELFKQRERAQKKEKETSSQIRMLQDQFSSFIQTAEIIPPCPGDAVRAAKGLRPLDDIRTDEDAKDEDDDDDDEDDW
ncbi:uncharacterized protein LOC107848646 [Capsicum annuum]|uniref:uncharacterized protein LOC107848646 n=1 Tax=Capsicum annuum TaxID=4072 RepID=UPI001FB0B35D|nr:uncharacterized protein LOC107848646 [Capsicum annuum]